MFSNRFRASVSGAVKKRARAELRAFCRSLRQVGYPTGGKWLLRELEAMFAVIDEQEAEISALKTEISRFTKQPET